MEPSYSQSSTITILLLKRALYNLNIALMQISTGAINSNLYRMCKYMFIPSAGNRNRINGLLNNQGTNGNYWSSTVSGTNARNLNFNSTVANTNNNNRANGFTVRCLKDYSMGSVVFICNSLFIINATQNLTTLCAIACPVPF